MTWNDELRRQVYEHQQRQDHERANRITESVLLERRHLDGPVLPFLPPPRLPANATPEENELYWLLFDLIMAADRARFDGVPEIILRGDGEGE